MKSFAVFCIFIIFISSLPCVASINPRQMKPGLPMEVAEDFSCEKEAIFFCEDNSTFRIDYGSYFQKFRIPGINKEHLEIILGLCQEKVSIQRISIETAVGICYRHLIIFQNGIKLRFLLCPLETNGE